LSDTPQGVSILVRVIPRASRTRIDGIRDGRLLVRLAANPVDGAANEALVAFLGKLLRLPSRNIAVTAGLQNRNKRLLLSGIEVEHVRAVLTKTLEALTFPDASRPTE
jgi:uncharacterized protein YggU (UPF0235/DUF167 family)